MGVINAVLETDDGDACLDTAGPTAVRHRGFAAQASAPKSARGAGGGTPAAALAPTPYMGWDTYFAFGANSMRRRCSIRQAS